MAADPPRYRELAEQLANRIRAGEFREGDPLPSITALVNESGSSVGVARDALRWLVEQGWAVGEQGKAYTVAAVPPEPTDQPSWDAWRRDTDERLAELERWRAEQEGQPRVIPTD